MNERDIFIAALQIDDDAERVAYLDEVCVGDEDLRKRVDALLDALHQAGSYLEQPAVQPPATINRTLVEQPGGQIGPYKLLQEIGQGGMGVVYMAEQIEPVRRKVALKIIKPGMDTRQVIARFNAERQALALMDHPNIAKVLDAGATESGRPFFVMELVRGVPITEYCDQHQLAPRQRLSLFVTVCQAVQHAHQKGIIHRDIKPSNVLVADYDDRPVPKVIDFGVAKAVQQRLTEKTMFTEFGQVIGTVEYMSPEQAKLNQLDVDTRTDVYSLGVLLYELMTGETPFNRERLRSAAFDEILRIICEEEPPRPSLRLHASASLMSVATNRAIELKEQSSLMRGELDWIVMKALDKDRARRYASASDFAEDIQRHLNDEAVAACPPSAAYRLRKLLRRNKTVFLVGTTILLILMGAVVATSRQAMQAARQRDRAVAAEMLATSRLTTERQAHQEATAINQLLQAALESANPESTKGTDYTVRQLLDEISVRLDDQFRNEPTTEAAVRSTIGNAYRRLGFWERANRHLQRALEIRERQFGSDHVEVARSLFDLAPNTMFRGDLAGAEAQIRRALAIHDKSHVRDNDTAKALSLLQLILGKEERFAESEKYGREAVAIARQQALPTSDLANFLTRLSYVVHQRGHDDEAEQMAREAVELHRRVHGDSHLDTGWGLCQLGVLLGEKQEYDEAEACLRESMEIFTKQYGDISYAWQTALEKLWSVYLAQADQAKLHALRADVATRARRAFRQRPSEDELLFIAASALEFVGDVDGAREICLHLLAMPPSSGSGFAGEDTSTEDLLHAADRMVELGELLCRAGEVAVSEVAYRKAFTLRCRVHGYGHADVVESLHGIVMALANQARTAEAQARYEKLINACTKVVDANATLAEGWALRGECYRLIGDYAKMADDYSQAIELSPENHWYWHERAYAHFRLGENEKSVADHTRAIQLFDHDAGQRLRRAGAYEVLGQLEQAEQDCRQALELAERAPLEKAGGMLLRAHIQLLSVLEAKGDHPSAQALLDEVPGICEQLIESKRFIDGNELEYAAWTLVIHPARDPAITQYAVKLAEKALALSPGKWDMYNTLGGAFCRAGNWEAAINTLRQAREMSGLYSPAEDGYLLALAYAGQGHREQARRWFDACERWVAVYGGSYQLQRLREEVALALDVPVTRPGRVKPTTEEQLTILKMFVEADPESSWSHASYGQALAERGDWRGAAEQFTSALDHAPDEDGVCCYYLAMARLRQGDLASYRDCHSAVISALQASDNDEVSGRLAWACGLGPNPSDHFRIPLDSSEALMAKHAEDPNFLRTLGLLHYRAAQYDKAAQRLRESLVALGTVDPDSSSLVLSQLLLAITKWRQGQQQEARKLLDATQATASAAIGSPSTSWSCRAALEILRREADALIRAGENLAIQPRGTAPHD